MSADPDTDGEFVLLLAAMSDQFIDDLEALDQMARWAEEEA